MNQNSNRTIIVVLAVIVGILLVAGVAYAISRPATTDTEPTATTKTTQTETTTETEDNQQPTESTDATEATTGATITFTDDGFSPSSYTVKKGSTVTVKNNSMMDVQFSSDDHPSHTEQTELNLRTLAPGESASFTVTKVGTWGFHDHINDEYTGTLTVTE